MKNVGTMLAIAMFLVAALAIFLLLGPMAEKPGMRMVTEESPEAGGKLPLTSSTDPRHKSAGKQGGSGGESAAMAMNIPPGGGSMPGSIPPVAAPSFPFPSAQDIPVGTEKSRLRRSYGKPNMVTTAVDQGRLIETYVYLRRDPNTATVVLLRNGRVVASNSTVY